MKEQNTASKTRSKDPQKQEEFCVMAGRLAGAVTRRLYTLRKQVERQLIKLSKTSYQVSRQALKKGKVVAKDSTIICKGLERKFELWRDQQKRQKLFTQLGAEVARLDKDKASGPLKQPKVKTLLKQIREIEQHFEGIRKTSATKRSKKSTAGKSAKKPRRRTRSKKVNPPFLAQGTEPEPEPA